MNIQTSTTLARSVSELCECGYTRIQFGLRPHLEQLREHYKEFLASLDDDERARWEFAVEETGKSDDGLIHRDGTNGYDLKYFFHWKPRLEKLLDGREIIRTTSQTDFLRECEHIFTRCLNRLFSIGDELTRTGLFGDGYDVREGMREALNHPPGPWHTTLRLLYYPPQPCGRRAGEHVDKSFLTFHMGDVGGSLYTCTSERASVTPVSPEEDEILVFFGEAAEERSEGKVRALLHGSMAEEGIARHAVVFFGHAADVPEYQPEGTMFPDGFGRDVCPA